MYIKYVLAFRKLEECYDQIVHPQKRRLIRHMLDGTIGRYIHACRLTCVYMYVIDTYIMYILGLMFDVFAGLITPPPLC